MTQFEENNPEQLKEFLYKLRILMDEYHPNTYTLDGVWEGSRKIELTIAEELDKQNCEYSGLPSVKSFINKTYDKEMVSRVSKINGKQYNEEMIDKVVDKISEDTGVMKEIYDKVMMEKTGMTEAEYEEYQQKQFHMERNADVAINRINDTLDRINTKLDMLVDALIDFE